MPMTASSMKSKIEAAIAASTGKPVDSSAANQIMALCTGIIQEIQANAQVLPGQAVATSGGPSNQSGTTISPGVIA